MTPQEHSEWQRKKSQLPAEHAAQWTEEVYDAYLLLKKARASWKKANGIPSEVLGSVKDDGMLTPLFIPNEPYMHYKSMQESWVKYEPTYIKDGRARMSRGDFGEEDSWEINSTS